MSWVLDKYGSEEEAIAARKKQQREDASLDMLQVLKDIDAASWEINSKLGERIRGVIRQAEGETK